MNPAQAHEFLTELANERMSGEVPFWQWPFRFFWRQSEGSTFRRGFGACYDTLDSMTSRVITVVTCPVPFNLLFGWLHKTYWTLRCAVNCRAGRTIHEFFHTKEAYAREAERQRISIECAVVNGWDAAIQWMSENVGKSEEEMRQSKEHWMGMLQVRRNRYL